MDSDIEEDVLLLASIHQSSSEKKQKRRRRFYINPYLRLRNEKGRFAKDFQDMRDYPPSFKENFHMNTDDFDYLLALLEPILSIKQRSRPDSISAAEKLAVTLEYLASGSYQRHIASMYRISKQNLGKVIEDTCLGLFRVLQPLCLNSLDSEEWIKASNRYNSLWNMPNCLGSIDGKHIPITCPAKSGSSFYNYKGFFSIVLMAVGDADYRFQYLDIGAYGSESDSTIFRNSQFGMELSTRKLKIPSEATVGNKKLPFFFVADDAFPLQERIMKPFVPVNKNRGLTNEERIFNYRLSRARRCIENAFGILCTKWRVLARTMQVNPDRAQIIVSACCALHNHLMKTSKNAYCPEGYSDRLGDDGIIIEGTWRTCIPENSCFNSGFTPALRGGRGSDRGKQVRIDLKDYLNSPEGSVSWQEASVFRTN